MSILCTLQILPNYTHQIRLGNNFRHHTQPEKRRRRKENGKSKTQKPKIISAGSEKQHMEDESDWYSASSP